MNRPQYLRAGWPAAKVAPRHRAYATQLADAGVTFDKMKTENRQAAEALVKERLIFDEPFRLTQEAGGILATHGEALIGVAVAEAAQFGSRVTMRVTALAVTPEWEGRGLGTVLLGMMHQLVPGRVQFLFGGCAPEAAQFYQRAGFDVLAPGEPMPFPFGSGAELASSNPHYPSMFFRSL